MSAQDTDPKVRLAAVEALGDFTYYPSATDLLQAIASKDDNQEIQVTAFIILRESGYI